MVDTADWPLIQQQLSAILHRYYTQPAGMPVVQHHSRAALYQEFHEPAPPETGLGMPAVLGDFESRLLSRSVQTWHPLFLNQMFAGAPLAAVAGDCLASMLNTTLATWEASPAATVIERNVTEWMAGLLGLPAGSSGIFVPGGSMANLLALTVARDRVLNPQGTARGLAGTRPGAIICSRATHYSVSNAARLLGIGTDGVVMVATDPHRLEMQPAAFAAALDECTRRGRTPFALVLTAGSPITGGVDPLAELVQRGHDHGLHVHVDAAFGGSLSLTSRRSLLAGIERADSVTWDAHKWLHVPLPCSTLLVPDPRVLREVFENPAGYLFHAGEETGLVDDLGRYTPLCAKRFDALKLWLVWRAWGTTAFRQMAESRLALAAQFHQTLAAAPDFQPAFEPVTPLLCFHYQPGVAPERSDAMHRWIREQLRQRGHAFINITRLADVEQFRVILINPLTTADDLQRLLANIRELGREFLETQR